VSDLQKFDTASVKSGFELRIAHVLLIAGVAIRVVLPGSAVFAAPPLAGCYERLYDTAHLTAHKGQIVERVRLAVTALSDPDMVKPLIAEAPLTFWVRKVKKPFSTSGVCRTKGEGLVCEGSLSVTETDECPDIKDGVRDCRITWPEAAGFFRIELRPDGVVVTIPSRLEVPGPDETDGVPFLYLSKGNVENHEFRLKAVAAARCKP
jgi:hypothetical protein